MNAASCGNFNASAYNISNNGGSSTFVLGAPIQATLSLNSKKITSGGGGENVDIFLVMDVSNSMHGIVDGVKKMDAAKDALLDVMDSIIAAGNLNNRVGYITFSGNITVQKGLTNNYNEVKVAISNTTEDEPGTGTSIGGGLYTAGEEFKNSVLKPDTKRFIVLASDGVQNGSPSITTGINNIPGDVTVYTVGFGNPTYLDPAEMTRIAETAGTGTGEYYYSDVRDLITVFRNITTQILTVLSLKNIGLVFTKDDKTRTSLSSTAPAYNSFNVLTGGIQWNNIGDLISGKSKKVVVNHTGTAVGTNIPLNANSLTVSYALSGTPCVDTVPVNVRQIDITSPCIDTTWTPASATFCTTQTLTQTSNCGNTRTISGTKQCVQCADTVDNDSDGAIDYPLDSGCFSANDNSEKKLRFQFF